MKVIAGGNKAEIRLLKTSKACVFKEFNVARHCAGGESAAIVLLESVLRLIPNVLGGIETLEEESFSDNTLLEYPQYTKPREWNGLNVPEVLTSGDHGKIKNWRDKKRVEITKIRKLDS